MPYDSTTTGFRKPTTNTTAQTVQPTCNQRAANDAVNDTTNVQPTMQSQNKIFPSFACDLQTHSSN